jgi:hypothetical protein
LRRASGHRLLSLVYPVRRYACSQQCGWSGLLPSVSGLQRRRRQLQTLLGIVALLLVVGLVWWRYRADLVWSPERPNVDESVEESSGEQ